MKLKKLESVAWTRVYHP